MVLCLMLKVVGLYIQHRARMKRVGSAGFTLLLVGAGRLFLSLLFFMLPASSTGFLPGLAGILVAAGLLSPPIGFLAFGLGLPGGSRLVPLTVGACLSIQSLISLTGLQRVGPMPAISTNVLIYLPALCMAIISYSVWSGTRSMTGAVGR
jgi:hypothetical protein